MRNKLIVLLLGLSGLLTAQSGAQTYSLQQALDYGLANHNSMRAALLDIASAKAQVREFKSIGMPKFDAQFGYTYFPNIPVSVIPNFIGPAVDGRLVQLNLIDPSQANFEITEFFTAQFGTTHNLNGSINFNMLLFDGSYFVGLKAARGLIDLNEAKMGLTRQEIRYNVTKAYYAVLAVGIGLETLDKNIANIEQLLSQTKAFNQQGFVEQLDVDRLELSLQNLRSERDLLSQQREVTIALLKFNMGYPMDQEIALADDINNLLAGVTDGSLATEKVSYAKRVEYGLLQQQMALNDLNIDRYKASYLPSVVGFASHSETLLRNNLFNNDEAGFNPTTALGLRVSVPIFDGFDRRSKIQRATLDRDRISLQINDFERAMALQVQSARTTFLNAVKRVQDRQATVGLAERILRTARTKYENGVGSSLEIVNAERELYAAQSNLLNSIYEVLNAKVELEKALGNLD
jgi:outer membrane protein TolC